MYPNKSNKYTAGKRCGKFRSSSDDDHRQTPRRLGADHQRLLDIRRFGRAGDEYPEARFVDLYPLVGLVHSPYERLAGQHDDGQLVAFLRRSPVKRSELDGYEQSALWAVGHISG